MIVSAHVCNLSNQLLSEIQRCCKIVLALSGYRVWLKEISHNVVVTLLLHLLHDMQCDVQRLC